MAITIQNLTRAYLKDSHITATVSTSGTEELLQKDGSLHLELESLQGGIFGDDTMGETTELLRCSLTLQNNDVNEIMAMVLESYRYVVVQQAQEANQHLADMVSTTLREKQQLEAREADLVNSFRFEIAELEEKGKELELGHEKLVNEFRIEAFELEEAERRATRQAGEHLNRIAELEEEIRKNTPPAIFERLDISCTVPGHRKLELLIERLELRIADLEGENKQLYDELERADACMQNLQALPTQQVGRPPNTLGHCGLCGEPGHNRRTCPTHKRQ